MLRAINLYQLVHQRVVVLSVVDNSAWAFFDPDGNCCYKQTGLNQVGPKSILSLPSHIIRQ